MVGFEWTGRLAWEGGGVFLMRPLGLAGGLWVCSLGGQSVWGLGRPSPLLRCAWPDGQVTTLSELTWISWNWARVWPACSTTALLPGGGSLGRLIVLAPELLPPSRLFAPFF